jgi:hypothetical protein
MHQHTVPAVIAALGVLELLAASTAAHASVGMRSSSRSSLMNFRGKAGSASALADSWHLTHADLLCCAVPIVVFLSIISVV